jgi:hypothetical protein
MSPLSSSVCSHPTLISSGNRVRGDWFSFFSMYYYLFWILIFNIKSLVWLLLCDI